MSQGKKQSITRILAGFVYSFSYDQLPDGARERAKCLILDQIGISIAGRDFPYSSIALKLAGSSKGESTLFTHRRKVSAPDAAFVNAVMGCVLDKDDALYPFHPGVINIPAAIAVAEQEQSTGAELITAVVAGYGVMVRVFRGAQSIRPAFRDGSVFGPFGAATAAAKLFKLTEEQIGDALGLAANMGGGLREWQLGGTKERDIFDPFAARNGIVAATLAREGIRAAEESLEGQRGFYQAFAGTGEHVGLAVKNLGKRFSIMDVRYKVYPVCFISQALIELSLGLVARYHTQADDIVEVTAKLSFADATHSGTDNEGPFLNSIQPLHSAQFAIAAAFLGKPVISDKFYREHYADADIEALAKKVKIVGEKDRRVSRVEVKLRDGKEYSDEGNRGGEQVPTHEKMVPRFEEHASDRIGPEKAAEVIEIVSHLESLPNVRDLTERLW